MRRRTATDSSLACMIQRSLLLPQLQMGPKQRVFVPLEKAAVAPDQSVGSLKGADDVRQMLIQNSIREPRERLAEIKGFM